MDTPYILLILNCHKYRTKALYQKVTWLPKLPTWLPYYHIIGDTEQAGGTHHFKFDDTERILWVATPDDYLSLPRKIAAAYEATLIRFGPHGLKYIFKTDDDQLLVKPTFFDTLRGLLHSNPYLHYGGMAVTLPPNYISTYGKYHPELPPAMPLKPIRYCTGRFYFLSVNAALAVLERRTELERECLEDYGVGLVLPAEYKTKDCLLPIAAPRIFTDLELSDYNDWVRSTHPL